MKEIELKDEIILTVKKAINDFSDIDVDLDYAQTSAAEIDLMANQVADTLIGQGWEKLSPSGSQKIFKDGYLKGFRDGQQEFRIIKQRNFELITKTERIAEEKAALENDVINNEMNRKTLTAENKRLKAQINDLKSAKEGYKKRFLDSGHRNKKLSLKMRTLEKEIERLEQVIKDKDRLCYDCKKSVEDFAESLEARCFDEEFYTPLHDAIEKELKGYGNDSNK